MFYCGNSRYGTHQHITRLEAKRCYGLLPSMAHFPAPAIVAPPVPEFGHRNNPFGPLSEPQLKYICSLRGDANKARMMSYDEASRYISSLKGGGSTMTAGSWTDPRLDLIAGIVDAVSDGYYAAQAEDGAHVTFIRLSTPAKGQYKDSRKFQTVHGSGLGVTLKDAAILWPSKRWSVNQNSLIDPLMWLCADPFGAALRYGELMKRCCRCNAKLTDGRSRWFRIGPECENYWPHVIQQVLEAKGPFEGER